LRLLPYGARLRVHETNGGATRPLRLLEKVWYPVPCETLEVISGKGVGTNLSLSRGKNSYRDSLQASLGKSELSSVTRGKKLENQGNPVTGKCGASGLGCSLQRKRGMKPFDA